MILRRDSLPLSILLFTAISFGCSSHQEPEAPAPAPPQEEAEPAPYVPGPSVADIQAAVGRHNTELRQCYLVGTFKNSQLAGTVNVQFTVNTEGKVSEAMDAGSDLPDPEVVQCVLGVFHKLEFAAGSTTDTQVEYPVKFGQTTG